MDKNGGYGPACGVCGQRHIGFKISCFWKMSKWLVNEVIGVGTGAPPKPLRQDTTSANTTDAQIAAGSTWTMAGVTSPTEARKALTEARKALVNRPTAGHPTAHGMLGQPEWAKERTRSTEPLTGWKKARIVTSFDSSHFEFRSMVHGVQYRADDVAVHAARTSQILNIDRTHPSPDPSGAQCNACGFYAYKERFLAESEYTTRKGYLLEVELYGKVVEYSKGYRAERQRVLAVWVPRRCVECHGQADGLYYLGYDLDPICMACFLRLSVDNDRLEYVTLSEVSNQLGCEVRWLEDPGDPDKDLYEIIA